MASSSTPSSVGAPNHLNSSGCVIKVVPGRGRGLYAERFIPRGTLLEISPVLLFEKEEYENHGKYTVLDHYTFVWPGNRMALALGLGSLFNHFDPPNVSFSLDPATDSIRYTTVQDVQPGDELCIFYGHNLWFTPSEGEKKKSDPDEPDDGWGGLAAVGEDENTDSTILQNPFEGGNPDDIIPDESLPFIRFKPPPEEETAESIRTIEAWVVNVPEPKHLGPLIKWLKQANLESPDVAHLKRIRKNLDTSETTLLLCLSADRPSPLLPEHLDLPEPYRVPVPATSALTTPSLALKTAIWPTMYTPKRKDEFEPWTRAQARWAWNAMHSAIMEASHAESSLGEKPIAAHIAEPYPSNPEEESLSFPAHDTRNSTNHPSATPP
ncbi:hypothetical protein D9611_008777 [Ephemerocybe angulata]|uniref:SET domain-containing protein n=1 Tax=Ephemerocybe angulata TaxID=980116 RepID=A0A8H5FJ12_9AGAR|nr:hypothetical protein D9611_008777 [Tulosesus angulatus]